METYTDTYTVHEHAVDMLVQFYDKQSMSAYLQALNIYTNGD